MNISVLYLPILNNLGEAKVSNLDAPLSRDEKILCHHHSNDGNIHEIPVSLWINHAIVEVRRRSSLLLKAAGRMSSRPMRTLGRYSLVPFGITVRTPLVLSSQTRSVQGAQK